MYLEITRSLCSRVINREIEVVEEITGYHNIDDVFTLLKFY